ncbi:MAG TPA: glycosyltransferase family 4 protein [Acidimicrobiales bacterium]|nr:glycosyltransferase family 4 protein [Acidimicrobiales bacterium]
MGDRGPPLTVLVVTAEPPWPPHHGGRIRVARMVDELRERLAVRVVAPLEAPPPAGLGVDELPPTRPVGVLARVAAPRPRLGRMMFGPERQEVLDHALARHRPAAVLFAGSYVAAAARVAGVSVAVDFQDLEVRRLASLARVGPARSRAANGLEAVKARGWEPRVARRAALATAANADDVRLLARWGAHALHVPHGADAFEPSPSPPRGAVTFVASFPYAPNRDAAEWLLREVWSRLRRVEPELPLRLVGRHARQVVGPSDGVDVVTDPPDVDRYYREASLVLAPVRVGGGPQLKVTEALSHGRAVVATSHSLRSVPAPARAGVVVADEPEEFAAAVLHLWRDLPARRLAEQRLAGALPLPTWQHTCAPLVAALERLAPGP